MESINKGGTHQTAYYWNLARPTTNCTNWIARWFLYRSFLNGEKTNRNVDGTSIPFLPSVYSQYPLSQPSLYTTNTNNQSSDPSRYTKDMNILRLPTYETLVAQYYMGMGSTKSRPNPK